ncbi:MAG: PD40 domain-containing protein [Bryobacterales bacterium]|nr:PD40 domain-containing protein [Bryobacterales bacterium]
MKYLALFAVLTAGVTLAQQPGPDDMPQEMIWVSRTGKILGKAGAQQNAMFFPEISPDGRYVAVSARDGEVNDRDVWIHDLTAGTKRVVAPAKGNDNFPLWSPDGKEIIFTSSRGGGYNLMRKSLDPDTPETMIVNLPDSEYPRSWSPDGKTLLFTGAKTKRDLFLLNLADPTPKPYITHATAWMDGARYSPDGQWVAYVSNIGGPFEVYVINAADPVNPRKISRELANGWAGGGGQVRWRADGKELFYVMGNEVMMSVEVGPGPTFGAPKRLFALPAMKGNFPEEAPYLAKYDVTKDGQKFLFVRTVRKPD